MSSFSPAANQNLDLSPILGGQLEQFNLEALDSLSFTDWVWRAVNGELDISLGGISEWVFRTFFNELWLNISLIQQLLLIAVISAIIRCLSDSFKTKSVSELGFYVSYVMIVATIFASFRVSAGILTNLVVQATTMMEASIPLMLSLNAMSGNISSAALLNPILFMGMALMSRFIAHVFIPIVTAAAVLHIVNQLVEGEIFSKAVSLMKKGSMLALKFMVFLFLTLLALQKLSAPIVNNLALRTARAAAGAVPVVGGALNSAMDTVINLSSAARSGVLVALIIVICIAVSIPLLKLLSFMFIYKTIAALIQPICDSRIVNCLDGLGDFVGMLLGAGVLVSVMFIFTCIILLSF